MLRITVKLENENSVRLKLDGTISSDNFGELADACSLHHGDDQRTVVLDMAGVAFMNDRAARELINMRDENLTIINCSPFIATLLETIAKAEPRE